MGGMGLGRMAAAVVLAGVPACMSLPEAPIALAPPIPAPVLATAIAEAPAVPAPERATIQLVCNENAAKPAPPRPAPNPNVELQSIEPIELPDSPLIAAVRSYERRQPDAAAQSLADLEALPRDFLVAMIPLAVRLSDGSLHRDNPQDIAALIERCNAALSSLRTKAALEIPKLCFCRPLAAPARFGAYERLDENHRFRPGETVGVYMELRNFSCVPQHGEFATHVQCSVEIRDAEDRIVFRFDAERTEPTLSPRQDYCHVGRFVLPPLPPGSYTLWLKATDAPTGRQARRSLDFRVGSDRS